MVWKHNSQLTVRQREVLKILVKRGRRRADDIEAVLGNRNAGDHRRWLALVTGGGRLKVLFLRVGFFIRKCACLHISFEGRARASLVIAVLFLVTFLCIMPFDAAEETKAFPVTPFFFFFRDFASLGFEVGIVDRRPVFFRSGSPGAKASPVSA